MTEKYLFEEYDLFEDKNWLTKREDIVEYFEENGADFLDCGQGYSQDETSILCKVGDKFYIVDIEAEIGSQKQDRGDRLYWVEDIESVSYEEVDKPLPKDRVNVFYNLSLTKAQKERLESFMDNASIDYN